LSLPHVRAFLTALLFLVTGPAAAKEWTHPALQFRFSVPDAFQPFPVEGDDLFKLARPIDGGAMLVVDVQRMHGVLGREPLDLKEGTFPQGAMVTRQPVPWNGFTLESLRVQLPQGATTLVLYEVQVPLTPEAIQVTVGGPREMETEARSTFQAMLGTVQGKTNWLTDAERSQRMGAGAVRLAGLLVGALVGLWVLFRWTATRRRPE
jgi:hypothetical protein